MKNFRSFFRTLIAGLATLILTFHASANSCSYGVMNNFKFGIK